LTIDAGCTIAAAVGVLKISTTENGVERSTVAVFEMLPTKGGATSTSVIVFVVSAGITPPLHVTTFVAASTVQPPAKSGAMKLWNGPARVTPARAMFMPLLPTVSTWQAAAAERRAHRPEQHRIRRVGLRDRQVDVRLDRRQLGVDAADALVLDVAGDRRRADEARAGEPDHLPGHRHEDRAARVERADAA
jgi:hypothetical protein